MAPQTLSALNMASKCLSKASKPLFNKGDNKAGSIDASKSFSSYSKPARSYYDMYNEPPQYDYDSIPDSNYLPDNFHVSNNGCGNVVEGDMTYINNAQDDTYSIPDTPFIPTVYTDDAVSGQGHRTL